MIATNVGKELERGLDISIISFVEALIEDAYHMRASDIHLEPDEGDVKIRFRIDGVLQDVQIFPRAMYAEALSRIKILAHLRTDEHQTAQDGRFRYELREDKKPIDVRVSVVPTFHEENTVMRLLADQEEEFTLEGLGFSEENRKKLINAIRRPYGMILATGPTGSGKTTTLYTLVKMLNTKAVSIITIEDPIEYSVGGIQQIQVNDRTGLSFANGLRSILRQDPNIIMVGEIRDTDTASIAVNTALTGHLLLSTLHTNDAATTLPRLLDMKVEPFLVASTVSIAIGQRLVRKICTTCKEDKIVTEEEYKRLVETVPSAVLNRNKKYFHGKGCPKCNGMAYKGHIVIAEVLVADEEIREAILRKASASEMKQLAIKNGMTTMLSDGFQKALQE